MDPLDATLPPPLPIRRILTRAGQIATRPVIISWLLTHIVLFYVLFVATNVLVRSQPWSAARSAALTLGSLALLAILSGTASAGVAYAAWTEHLGQRATVGACAGAIGARGGRIVAESLRIGGLTLIGALCFGVGALWALGATCAIVPSCVCERSLSAKAAAASGERLLQGNQTRALAMYILVTPIALASNIAMRTLGLLLEPASIAPLLRMPMGVSAAGLMAGACVYALLGAATYVELRSTGPTGRELARTFE